MLQMFGLKPEDMPPEIVEVWECVWPSFATFEAMATQWRVGMNGATGLEYATIPSVVEMLGYEKDQLKLIFQDIRFLENEALSIMRESQ